MPICFQRRSYKFTLSFNEFLRCCIRYISINMKVNHRFRTREQTIESTTLCSASCLYRTSCGAYQVCGMSTSVYVLLLPPRTLSVYLHICLLFTYEFLNKLYFFLNFSAFFKTIFDTFYRIDNRCVIASSKRFSYQRKRYVKHLATQIDSNLTRI